MNKAIDDIREKFYDVEKRRIEVRLAIYFVSNASCHESRKDKSKFIKVM